MDSSTKNIRHILLGLCIAFHLFYFTLATSQKLNVFIKPQTIDSTYAENEDSMYVALNKDVISNNKLLLFLPGTGAKTKHYLLFPNLASTLGYHCISLAYPNGYPTVAALCGNNSDSNCYYNIRQEVCYGTDVSTNVTVDTLNSIVTRLIKTLQYLEKTYPSDGWGQFLENNGPVWNKMAVSGHSQGGGHALYLAKTNKCNRMIMFAGADDYSNYYTSPANWTYFSSLTPVSEFYSFLNLNDDVWDYSKQFAVVKATGMTASGDDSTIVDNALPPYSGSHCLYTSVTPLHPLIYSAEHNSMVVDYYTPLDNTNEPLYKPVWTYMLTHSETTSNKILLRKNFNVFPNPATAYIIVQNPLNETFSIQILNITGEVVYIQTNLHTKQMSISINNWKPGIYIVREISSKNQFVQKICVEGK